MKSFWLSSANLMAQTLGYLSMLLSMFWMNMSACYLSLFYLSSLLADKMLLGFFNSMCGLSSHFILTTALECISFSHQGLFLWIWHYHLNTEESINQFFIFNQEFIHIQNIQITFHSHDIFIFSFHFWVLLNAYVFLHNHPF